MTKNPAGVVFLGPDPLPALGSGLPVICADGCGLSQADGPGWESFDGPGSASSATLLGLLAVQERLRSEAAAVVVWKSSAEVERRARELGVVVANSPALIARRIENKSHFSRAALAAGLPIPPTQAGVAGPELLKASRELSGPLVFQLAHGFSGEQTYLARSAAELEELIHRFEGRSCRVAAQVAGTPVTVTGVVAENRLMIGPACLQLTGLPSLTPHPLGSCGNDYGRPVPQREKIHQVALQTAEWLRRQGHLGIFGLDLLVDEDGATWCIEVNPRLVASVPLFSLSARDLGRPGILDHHLASFGIVENIDEELACHWSQVILYQREERLPKPERHTARGPLAESGGFSVTGQLGLAGPPPGEAGLLVQAQSRPGRELARVFLQGACCAPDGTLLPHLEALVSELRSHLEAPRGTPTVS
ncbi:MAG TPA: YheC/YheD family protein [Candidatus Acidoferrales bacterium]|nr:YheC/YheD family protein [Candidatus Acidoferrales bacterium]